MTAISNRRSGGARHKAVPLRQDGGTASRRSWTRLASRPGSGSTTPRANKFPVRGPAGSEFADHQCAEAFPPPLGWRITLASMLAAAACSFVGHGRWLTSAAVCRNSQRRADAVVVEPLRISAQRHRASSRGAARKTASGPPFRQLVRSLHWPILWPGRRFGAWIPARTGPAGMSKPLAHSAGANPDHWKPGSKCGTEEVNPEVAMQPQYRSSDCPSAGAVHQAFSGK